MQALQALQEMLLGLGKLQATMGNVVLCKQDCQVLVGPF